jgi:fatty acid desaturase
MPGPAKSMGVLTVGTLVVVTAYTAAMGSNGWLWFGWVVLLLATVGTAATTRSR